ncbi:MAG TPA: hypothetical protein VGU23_04890, partial [Acidobacteriaceae bacterium]|nr:hypothetical protein [Acidobacteriaceae bacterium]
AFGWAIFIGSGFVGIGGMDLPATISDQGIQQFWKIGGLVTIISLIIALLIFTRGAIRAKLLSRYQ